MNLLSPDMVLGKEVVDARGGVVGEVVDVGVHDMRRVKFLLVRDGAAAPRPRSGLTRLNVDLIDTVDARVILKP